MKLAIKVGMILILISINQGFGQTVFTVTSTGDGGDSNPGNGICDDGTGDCTLRAAMEEANAVAGKDTIAFDIPGDGPHTIQPSSGLPGITDSVYIDGYTQPGASPNSNPPNLGKNTILMIEIDGTNADANGFTINFENSTLRGMAINRFSGHGIIILASGGNSIEGNFIGTDISGTVAMGNGEWGVGIWEASQFNTIGTDGDGVADAAEGNVISGNGLDGVVITFEASQNVVAGNYIGTDLTGTFAVPNGLGTGRGGVEIANGAT